MKKVPIDVVCKEIGSLSPAMEKPAIIEDDDECVSERATSFVIGFCRHSAWEVQRRKIEELHRSWSIW